MLPTHHPAQLLEKAPQTEYCACGTKCDFDWPYTDAEGRPQCSACEEEWRWNALRILALKRGLCPTCGGTIKNNDPRKRGTS